MRIYWVTFGVYFYRKEVGKLPFYLSNAYPR